MLADDRALGDDALDQVAVFRWVDDVQAAAEDGDRTAAGVERRAMRVRVDAAGEATDDSDCRAGQLADQPLGRDASVRRQPAGADDGDSQVIPRAQVTPQEEDWRRCVDLAEARRVGWIVDGDNSNAGHLEAAHLGVGVERAAHVQKRMDRPPVQSAGRQLAGRRLPGRLYVPEGVQQPPQADDPDARDAVEADPIGRAGLQRERHGGDYSSACSSLKASCSALTASAVRSPSMMQVIRISEVVIISMLIPRSASARNIRAA